MIEFGIGIEEKDRIAASKLFEAIFGEIPVDVTAGSGLDLITLVEGMQVVLDSPQPLTAQEAIVLSMRFGVNFEFDSTLEE